MFVLQVGRSIENLQHVFPVGAFEMVVPGGVGALRSVGVIRLLSAILLRAAGGTAGNAYSAAEQFLAGQMSTASNDLFRRQVRLTEVEVSTETDPSAATTDADLVKKINALSPEMGALFDRAATAGKAVLTIAREDNLLAQYPTLGGRAATAGKAVLTIAKEDNLLAKYPTLGGRAATAGMSVSTIAKDDYVNNHTDGWAQRSMTDIFGEAATAGAAAGAAAMAVPAGGTWTSVVDPETGKPYFWHTMTQNVRWEMPPSTTSATTTTTPTTAAAAPPLPEPCALPEPCVRVVRDVGKTVNGDLVLQEGAIIYMVRPVPGTKDWLTGRVLVTSGGLRKGMFQASDAYPILAADRRPIAEMKTVPNGHTDTLLTIEYRKATSVVAAAAAALGAAAAAGHK
jgi:hypothetical protein